MSVHAHINNRVAFCLLRHPKNNNLYVLYAILSITTAPLPVFYTHPSECMRLPTRVDMSAPMARKLYFAYVEKDLGAFSPAAS